MAQWHLAWGFGLVLSLVALEIGIRGIWRGGDTSDSGDPRGREENVERLRSTVVPSQDEVSPPRIDACQPRRTSSSVPTRSARAPLQV